MCAVNVVISDLKNICRCCLAGEVETVSILNVYLDEIRLCDVWETITSIKIKTMDESTNNVCVVCIDRIKHYYEFRVQCQKADLILKNVLQNRKTTVDTDDITNNAGDDRLSNSETNDIEFVGTISDLFSLDLTNVEELNETLNVNKESNIDESNNEAREMDLMVEREHLDLDNLFQTKELEMFEANEEIMFDINEKASSCEDRLLPDNLTDTEQSNINENMEIDPLTTNPLFKIKKPSLLKPIIQTVQPMVMKGQKRKPSKCETCGKTFPTFKELKEHIDRTSHSTSDLTCKICNKVVSKRSTLKQHMQLHTDERPHACQHCGRRFSLKNNRDRHEKQHTGEKPFVCDQCGAGFTRSTQLAEHQVKHTNNYKHVCSHCGKKFATDSVYNKHMTYHHGKLKNKEGTVAKGQMAECKICNKTLKNRHILYVHQQVSHKEKRFLCTVCGRQCSTKISLDIHSRIHSGLKPYKCEFCGKNFTHNSSLRAHIRSHVGEKPYRCKVCPKSFGQRSHLSYHMLTHGDEKKHKCMDCGKAFHLKNNLTVHVRLHTGERPYVCDKCGKGFCDSSSRKRHVVKHHT